MAEEEDDYMGDLSQFLPSQPEASSNPPAQKVPSINTGSNSASLQSSKKRPKHRNWQEQRKQKREIKQVEEDERTLASLESAIPQSNIGFKMLKQMGYTPGSGLGGSGRAEPVGLEIRRSRAGIGREDPIKEKLRKEEELVWENRRKEEELMADFGCRVKERWRNKRVVVNFHKAKGVLDQLENKDIVEIEKKNDDDDDDDEKQESDEEEVITEEDLHEILMKLRGDFHYCLFCGCQYESMELLLANCPGINEDDH